ncbi:MAG: hypothetical protein LBR56_00935 [Sporomusaceae bacterium]|jgi:hypothetical protein|nr:hypothetical protein [Sporomusaceae bacterium]
MTEKKKRGGARAGAGRKIEAGEVRKPRTLRATDKEWQSILKFAQNLKKEERMKMKSEEI